MSNRKTGCNPLKAPVSPWALLCRSAALAFILYQMRLFAGDLADTGVFTALLLAGFVIPLVLARLASIRNLTTDHTDLTDRNRFPTPDSPLPIPHSLLIIALVPWAARLFIALPRYAVSGPAVTLDSLLLNLDRNYFAALIPFYWAAFSTWFSLKSPLFLRGDILAADGLFLALYSLRPAASLAAYRWPVLMIALFALTLYLQVLAFLLSIPAEMKLRRKEGAQAALAFLLLVIAGGAFLIRPSQEKAAERGGGLLEPKLFRFDFSQVLRLDAEISMNDDLVLIAKKDTLDGHILIRRFTLSGYSSKQGFFRAEEDEAAHPQRLPERRTILPADPIELYQEANQEYYLVNFDASAFLGMNMPVEIIPFETWDASSFSAAYGVKSLTSDALSFELMDAVPGYGDITPESLGMSPADYAFYTDYGGSERIAAYAEEICWGVRGYWDRIEAVFDHLKNGDYRYSLKPGIAPDGDQLSRFLFETKKGYCSYFAFAFSLLLRSMGVPCRVAAGFFIDPETNVFNYYPVRSDMAHAWVEVWFPRYGWIEYDPTTERLAEGEEFRFSQGTPPELFERLMKEILDNHSKLREKEGGDEAGGLSLARLGEETVKFLRRRGLFLAAVLVILLFGWIRAGGLWLAFLARKPRKKALRLWAHAGRRLALAGYRRGRAGTEGEAGGTASWVTAMEARSFRLDAFYRLVQKARFARDFTPADSLAVEEAYRRFDRSYRETVPAGRRLLAWLFPPLALSLRAGKSAGKRRGKAGTALLLLAALFLALEGGAQEETPSPDSLFEQAQAARDAEFWERAVELYSRGESLYPWDSRFPWALGNLYFYRELYHLAWDEYRRVEANNPGDPGLLFSLARTAGYLNEDRVSAEYLERLLRIDPDNSEAIGTLGWMYYKIHRLGDGERLLVSAIERLGVNADFAMTLGTIYSDLFRYEEAKRWYLESIEQAEDAGDRVFAAVAHYNLSILESRFYEFGLALERTNRSLASLNRASGRLARGELFLRRLEIGPALGEYQLAYEMDTSPLSKVNLAQAYQIAGRLEEARLYAEACLEAEDESWMLNYGIDPVRYRRDLHEILKNTYEGLAKTEGFLDCASLPEKGRSLLRSVRYRFKAAVHKLLFRKYSLLAGNAYGLDSYTGGGPHLDALLQYYNAFADYPRRAAVYLRKARDFEEPLIPASVPSYDYEEGKMLKNTGLLIEAIEGFDPQWERDMLAGAYAEIALETARKGRREESRDAAERLYALNRGALRQKGIRLPAELLAKGPPGAARAAVLAARKAGIAPVPADGDARYTLTLEVDDAGGAALCTLRDNGRGRTMFNRTLPLGESRAERAAFSLALGDALFTAE